MEIFSKLRENNKIIAMLVSWQKSVWYPAVYALLGVISCSCGMAAYIPVFYVMALGVVFGALFNDDPKTLLVPVLLSYFALGGDGLLSYGMAVENIWQFFNPAGLVNVLVAGAIMLAALVFRIVAGGLYKDIFCKHGLLTCGMLCMAAAFLLNGAFSGAWQPIDLAYGVLEAVGFLFAYFVVLSVSNHTTDLVSYVCRLCLLCALMICAQSWILMGKLAAEGKLLELDELGRWTGGFVRDYQVLGWGVSTYAAGVLALLIPPVMFLAYKHRYGVWYYIAALVMFLTIVLLNARASMLMGGVILAACMVVCCFGPNKKANRIVAICAVALAIVSLVALIFGMGVERFSDFIANMLRFEQGDNDRFNRWADGWKDFLSAPVFGVGFADGGVSAGAAQGNMFSNMYHNFAVELIGAMGVAGVIAFLIHIKEVIELCVRKFRAERLLLLFGALTVLLTGLLDNFFFIFSIQLFYGAFLAVSEVHLEQTRAECLAAHKRIAQGRKPRVVFTFIEAGLGHIIAERGVCNAFEKKYGDKVDVVSSRFYQETDNAALKKFEESLVKPVEIQSRSRFFGKLCIFGNQLFGDTIAHEFVMRLRGLDSVKPALDHMKELDADIVFTTHWATAYYVGKMKEDRPYLMMYCPDLYSNGMFNMDCNDFLISTKEGLAEVNRLRMYGGGNGSAVKYPIRDEAFALVGKRNEIREQLGIPQDRFVVVLSDGGYGMAKLESTVRELVRYEKEITIFAVCGKNAEGAERLKKLECAKGIDLRVYGFTDRMLEFLCMADLYVGKSGANSIAEPTFFGLPVILTKCITPIEEGTRKYFRDIIGNAIFIPSPKKAAEKIVYFSEHRDELLKLAANTERRKGAYGAEQIADLIYQRTVELTETTMRERGENGSVDPGFYASAHRAGEGKSKSGLFRKAGHRGFSKKR